MRLLVLLGFFISVNTGAFSLKAKNSSPPFFPDRWQATYQSDASSIISFGYDKIPLTPKSHLAVGFNLSAKHTIDLLQYTLLTTELGAERSVRCCYSVLPELFQTTPPTRKIALGFYAPHYDLLWSVKEPQTKSCFPSSIRLTIAKQSSWWKQLEFNTPTLQHPILYSIDFNCIHNPNPPQQHSNYLKKCGITWYPAKLPEGRFHITIDPTFFSKQYLSSLKSLTIEVTYKEQQLKVGFILAISLSKECQLHLKIQSDSAKKCTFAINLTWNSTAKPLPDPLHTR